MKVTATLILLISFLTIVFTKVPTKQLNNGVEMPVLGLGTGASGHGTKEVILEAIKAGYRLIDTRMQVPGKNRKAHGAEPVIGEALTEAFKQGLVKREEMFLTSKVPNSYHSRKAALEAVNNSVHNLELKYIDLMLIHWPYALAEGMGLKPKDENNKTFYADIDYLETWKGLEDAHKLGLVKSIGLSNFNSEQVQRVIDNAIIKPVVNEIECHPYLSQVPLIKFLSDRNVSVEGYSPLGKARYLNDTKFDEIGSKHNKTAAQVMLRWNVQRGVTVIPKARNFTYIHENINIFDFELTKHEMKEIDGLNKNLRFVTAHGAESQKYYPFKIPF